METVDLPLLKLSFCLLFLIYLVFKYDYHDNTKMPSPCAGLYGRRVLT